MSDLDHTYCSRCNTSSYKEIHGADKCADILRKQNDALEYALKAKEEEIEERVKRNRLHGYKDGKKENEEEVKRLKNELYRIRCVAERLKNSDDENEISLEENIAGKYMLKALDGENFS